MPKPTGKAKGAAKEAPVRITRQMAKAVVTLPREVKAILSTFTDKEARTAFKHIMLDAEYAAEQAKKASARRAAKDDASE